MTQVTQAPAFRLPAATPECVGYDQAFACHFGAVHEHQEAPVDESLATIECTVSSLTAGGKGLVFEHRGQTCYALDVRRGAFPEIRKGDVVRLTGCWSKAVACVFEAQEVAMRAAR